MMTEKKLAVGRLDFLNTNGDYISACWHQTRTHIVWVNYDGCNMLLGCSIAGEILICLSI